MNPQEYKKTIVILGPTASGKSDLAIAPTEEHLAQIKSLEGVESVL